MEEQNPKSEIRRKLLIAAGVLLGLAVLLVVTAPDNGASTTAGNGPSLREVRAWEAIAQRWPATVELSGVLGADRHVRLAAESSGRVVRAHAEAFDTVSEGELLLEIDPLRGEMALRQAEARVRRAESELALARSDSARSESLMKKDVLSDSEMEGIRSRLQIAEAADAEARAGLELARDDLDKRLMRAPFGGTLRSFTVEENEFVTAGQPVGEVLDLSVLKLDAGLTDRDVVWLETGSPVEVRLEAMPDRVFAGTVRRIGSAAEARSRKFPVEIEIPNPDGVLLPGMVGRARLELSREDDVLAVPREAIREQLGVFSVFVMEPGDGNDTATLRRQLVRTRPLPFRPTLTEITEGLASGERIAISEAGQLRDGEVVRMARTEEP